MLRTEAPLKRRFSSAGFTLAWSLSACSTDADQMQLVARDRLKTVKGVLTVLLHTPAALELRWVHACLVALSLQHRNWSDTSCRHKQAIEGQRRPSRPVVQAGSPSAQNLHLLGCSQLAHRMHDDRRSQLCEGLETDFGCSAAQSSRLLVAHIFGQRAMVHSAVQGAPCCQLPSRLCRQGSAHPLPGARQQPQRQLGAPLLMLHRPLLRQPHHPGSRQPADMRLQLKALRQSTGFHTWPPGCKLPVHNNAMQLPAAQLRASGCS